MMNGKKLMAGERVGSMLSINYPLAYQQMNQFGAQSMHSLCSSVAPSTIIEQQAQRLHENFIIDDYMQKIDTKIELLENELKFAWRALDLLTTEYSKMAQKLDKIDKLAGDQQLVVQNLINLTLHNDANAYEDMLENSDRYEAFRRKVLEEAVAADISAPFQINDLEFDSADNINLENFGKLSGGSELCTIVDMEESNASLYDCSADVANATKSDIPIYYSSNPFRDTDMFDSRLDSEMKLSRPDGGEGNYDNEKMRTMSFQQKKLKLDEAESDNFEHFKKRLETLKQDVYENNDGSGEASARNQANNTGNMQSYLKELLMAQRVGDGLEEGIDPISDLDPGNVHSKHNDIMGNGDGIQRTGQRSSKRNRSQHKKLIANEMELLNNQMLQLRQQKTRQIEVDQKDDAQKRTVLVDVVSRLINERYQHIRHDKALVSEKTLEILHNETYLLMRIFFFFYMRSAAITGERDRGTMLWLFLSQVLGEPDFTELDDSGINLLNNHIQMTIEMLKTLTATNFQDHLQKKLDEAKLQPVGHYSVSHAIDFDIESFFCKGSSPKISISNVIDFELQIEKEDEPIPSRSSSCYQFELIKRRYEMEEQKGKEKPAATHSATEHALPSASSLSQEQNEHIYNNDEYIQSLKRNLERHNSMLYLLHLQGQEKDKDKCDLEDDKNKIMLDILMDQLLQDEQTQEVATKSVPEAIQDYDEMNSSNSPPPPAPIAPFLCREQDDDSEDGIEYDDDFAGMMVNEGNMNVDDFLNRSSRDLLQFETWNDFAPECDQNLIYGYGLESGAPVTGKVIHSKPKASQKSGSASEHKQHMKQGYSDASTGGREHKNLRHGSELDCSEVDSNLKYLEQMGRSQPICSPFENRSRFVSSLHELPMESQLTGPPDLLKMYLEQQHSSTVVRRAIVPKPALPLVRAPIAATVPEGFPATRPRTHPCPPTRPPPPMRPPDPRLGGTNERGASKKRKFQMVAKLQHWLHDQSSSSGNESRSAVESPGGNSRSWLKKKNFRFRSQSLSEPMRSDRESEVSDQESLEGGYMSTGRRRSFMKTVKKEIGKRVRKVIVKGGPTSGAYSSHPDLAVPTSSNKYLTDDDQSDYEKPNLPPASLLQPISMEGPVCVQVSEPMEAEGVSDLFLKVGDHPKPHSPATTLNTTTTKSDEAAHRTSGQFLTQGTQINTNTKSASLSSSNSATSSGGESGGLGGVVNAQSSGPNAFLFNNSTSMEFAASRKVGKYRKGKRESSADGYSDTTESGSNINSSGDNNSSNNIPHGSTRRESVEGSMGEDTEYTDKVDTVFVPHVRPTLHFPHIQKVNSICIDECNDPLVETIGELQNTEIIEEDALPVSKPVTTSSSPSVQGGNTALLTTNWSVDEDSRSQHSYRTIASGGTSRRQSTEDSIDTDDEYFCYELRKLEEMEREAHDISFLKESGQLPQFEFEDSNMVEPTLGRVPEETVDMVDESLKEFFRKSVHPELKIHSQSHMARTLGILKAFEETRIIPVKRKDGSGLNFLLRGEDDERKSNIRFYNRELRHLENPTAESEEDEVSDGGFDSAEEIRSCDRSHSVASSSTTSGPESNPDEFSDYEEELEGQDKLREEFHHPIGHNEPDETHAGDVFGIMENNVADETVPDRDLGEENKAEAGGAVGGVVVGAGGGASKWKLLKTLKDRKAEERTNQGKIKEEEDTKDKVSLESCSTNT